MQCKYVLCNDEIILILKFLMMFFFYIRLYMIDVHILLGHNNIKFKYSLGIWATQTSEEHQSE